MNRSNKYVFDGTQVVGRRSRDIESYKLQCSGKIGRSIEGHININFDFLRPHVTLICGKKGYGKSYTMGVVIEEFLKLDNSIRKNLSMVLMDTMGIFWSLKYKNYNDYEKQLLLNKWNLETMGFEDVQIFIPKKFKDKFDESGIPYDDIILINPGDLEDMDWCYVFNIDYNSPLGMGISSIIESLKEKAGNDFLISHIIKEIKDGKVELAVQTKQALLRRFRVAFDWGIFTGKNDNPTKITDIVQRGKVSVINLSEFREDLQGGKGVRELVVGIIARQIFDKRIEARKIEQIQNTIKELGLKKSSSINIDYTPFPMTWMVIDEAHRFVPTRKNTASSLPIIMWARRGRQPGLSLILATQRPGSLHDDVISQCDLVFTHRITSENDIAALNKIRPVYSSKSMLEILSELPIEMPGNAIIIDDVCEDILSINIRPRQSWHAGEDASALSMFNVND